jgi:hypothetical protein
MTSREKVLRLRQWLLGLKAEDEESARNLQVLSAIAPLLVKALPNDPAELDRYLRTIAWGAIECRSDEAAPMMLFEWDGEEWRQVDVEFAPVEPSS